MLFVAMLSMAFLTGCEESRVHGAVSSAGAEAVVSPAPTPTYSKRQLEEWHDVVISDSPNWEGSLRYLEPATGYGLVTMTTVDVEAGRVRRQCGTLSPDTTGYRNIVDVDLVGRLDPADQYYRIFNVNCRVYANGSPYNG